MPLGISARLRPKAVLEVEMGQDWLLDQAPDDEWQAARRLQEYYHNLRLRWDGRKRRWEVWEITRCGPDYVLTWQGPNGEFRRPTGIVCKLRQMDELRLSQYERSVRQIEMQEKRKEAESEQHRTERCEQIIRSADERWGWRDPSISKVSPEKIIRQSRG